jgi:hypothetical protein
VPGNWYPYRDSTYGAGTGRPGGSASRMRFVVPTLLLRKSVESFVCFVDKRKAKRISLYAFYDL